MRRERRDNVTAGILLNYALIAAGNLSSLVMVPILRDGLGNEAYGVYLMAMSIITFFAVSDYHIGTLFVNEIVKRNTDERQNELGRYIFGMLPAFLLFGAAVLLVCFGVAQAYPLLFQERISERSVELFHQLLGLLSVNCFLLFIQNYLFCIITGLGFLSYTRVCNIVRIILRTVTLALLMRGGHGPQVVVLTDIALTGFIILAFVAYARWINAPFTPDSIRRGTLTQNLPPMLMLYIMPMLDNLYWAICVQMVGRSISPAAVVEFNIALVFCQVFVQLVVTLSYVRMGEVARLNQEGDAARLRAYITRIGVMQSAFLGLVLVAFAAAGRLFLRLWLGEGVSQGAYGIALVMMCSMFPQLSHDMLEIELYAKDGYHLRTMAVGVMTAANLVFTVLFIRFGLYGVAASVALTMLLFGYGLMNVMLQRAGIPAWRFSANVFRKIVPSLTVGLGAAMAVSLRVGGGVVREVLWALLPIALYGALVSAAILSAGQRQKAIALARRALRLP